jgi:Cof subfamily protein (haloacid dehalogenase superfamily)
MTYRLIAIDLDGTLLNSANAVSERNAAALRAAIAGGLVVAAATARPYQSARRIFEALELDVPVIASGGASVRDAAGTVIREAALPPGAAPAMAAICHARGWGLTLATGEAMFFMAAERPEWIGRTQRRVEFLEHPGAVPGSGVLSLIINGPPDAELALGLEAWDGAVQAYRARTNDMATLTTVTATGADKGHGLRHLCVHFGLETSHAVAIGDSEVDLPMFAVAGLAVAMGNAGDAVKRQARHVTASADDDGVADVLEGLLGAALGKGGLPASGAGTAQALQ